MRRPPRCGRNSTLLVESTLARRARGPPPASVPRSRPRPRGVRRGSGRRPASSSSRSSSGRSLLRGDRATLISSRRSHLAPDLTHRPSPHLRSDASRIVQRNAPRSPGERLNEADVVLGLDAASIRRRSSRSSSSSSRNFPASRRATITTSRSPTGARPPAPLDPLGAHVSRRQHRTVIYLSAEYLIGPQLGNNLLTLGMRARRARRWSRSA